MPKAPKNQALPSPEEYARFVEGLELVGVRLVEAQVRAHHPRPDPRKGDVRVEEEYTYQPAKGVLEARARYRVVFSDKDMGEEWGRVEAVFGFIYRTQVSKKEVERFLPIFKETSLPLNAWPYLREFVHTTMGRMGWTPLVLPLRKAGVKPMEE